MAIEYETRRFPLEQRISGKATMKFRGIGAHRSEAKLEKLSMEVRNN